MKRAAVILLIGVLAAACGGGSDSGEPQTGPALSGQDLFELPILGPNPGCITCHSMDPDTTLVGPSLAGIAARAGSRVPGLSAGDYLRQSILNPSAYLVDGFDDGKMPTDLGEVLSSAEIDAVVAYLLTLG